MVEMPYSFDQVNTNNNVLTYGWRSSGHGNFDSTVTFPPGNYNITQLLAELAYLLFNDINEQSTAAGTPANLLIGYFKFSYNATTGVTTLYLQGPGVFYANTIILDFRDAGFVLGTMFGFPAQEFSFGDIPVSGIPLSFPLVSPNKVMVNPITSVYIRSESLKFESNYEAVVRNATPILPVSDPPQYRNFQNSDILTKIPVTTLPNSIIYYRTEQHSIISNKEIGELNLYVSDNLSSTFTLDLQGLNYGIYVLFEEIIIPMLNQYQDKIQSVLEMPQDLIEERRRLIEDLTKQKAELEKQIKQQQEEKQNNLL
jgi:hypothetical protein